MSKYNNIIYKEEFREYLSLDVTSLFFVKDASLFKGGWSSWWLFESAQPLSFDSWMKHLDEED